MTLLFPTRDPLGLRSSPIEAQAKSPYNSIRKPSGAFHPSPRLRRTKWCVGCGCVVVCRRFPSGLEIAHQTPLPRAWPLATLLRKATFGRATLAYARHNNRGCRESYPRCTLACAFPIGRGVSRRLQVRFSADTRGESRRRSRRRRARHFFGQSRLPKKSPRSSCPRNPLSVDLTLTLSCGRGLTRP